MVSLVCLVMYCFVVCICIHPRVILMCAYISYLPENIQALLVAMTTCTVYDNLTMQLYI